jgi:hypothetical protein
MHSGLYKFASALSILLLGGCAQMTRHSNMVVFGTNTSVGVRVGTSATSVPEVQLGYSRQEAVVMPLVANTGSGGGRNSDLLEPCDITAPVDVSGGAQFAVHPCSLVAIHGESLDSYSVLASFGARFGGSGNADGADANVGLAQYFSTGMAAQLLALNGGAAVVAVSQAATTASANPVSEGAVQGLFGEASAFEAGVAQQEPYADFQGRLVALVEALASDDDVKTKIANFEINAEIPVAARLTEACATKAGCLAAIRGEAYRQSYVTRGSQMTAALERW